MPSRSTLLYPPGRSVPAVIDTGAARSIISRHTLPGRFGLRRFIVAEHPVDVLAGRQIVLAYQDRSLYVSR